MIVLLVPLRWWRQSGTPTYSEAPQRRYVWAPADPRAMAVFPSEPEEEDIRAMAVPPDNRSMIA